MINTLAAIEDLLNKTGLAADTPMTFATSAYTAETSDSADTAATEQLAFPVLNQLSESLVTAASYFEQRPDLAALSILLDADEDDSNSA